MLALGWTWTRVRFTVSWKPQFDLGGHLGDVKSMIHTRNRSSQSKETDFPETSRQQQQHQTQTQPFVESARLQMNRIGAGTPLLACVAQTRKTRFIHKKRVTPQTCTCSPDPIHAAYVCLLIHACTAIVRVYRCHRDRVHNLGRANNCFMSISNLVFSDSIHRNVLLLLKCACEKLGNSGL